MKARCPARPGGLIVLFIVSALALFAGSTHAIEFDLDHCTLQIGKERLKPVEIAVPWGLTYRVGKGRFMIRGDRIYRFGLSPGKASWTAQSDNGLHLRWLGAEKDIAYLTAYYIDQHGYARESELPPRLRRLDLNSGQWLSSLPLSDTNLNYAVKEVIAVLATNNAVVVLSHGSTKDPAEAAAFGLRLFKEGGDKPVWSREFPSADKRPYTGGVLWAAQVPQYASSDITPLSWMGERLLVCPEAMQPIRCLNPDTGSEIWQIDRLWEFRRNFIGPSVGSHEIGRFGVGLLGDTKTNLVEERKAFNEQFSCALAGGPVIVPVEFDYDYIPHSHRIFVAAVKGPADGYAGYLSDCILYELGSNGDVVSMITLPQVVRGSQFCVRPGGVVWKCQSEMFVKISPRRTPLERRMGPGGPDLIANLPWSRQIQYTEPEAWFVSGKAGDPAAFGESHAYSLPGGGYVTRSNESTYSFPIVAVDLATGFDRLMLLKVPFKGQFLLPERNITTTSLGNGTESTRADSFHLLAITHIAAEAGEIEITLATEKERYGLRFAPQKALQETETLVSRPPMPAIRSAQARAKLVNRKSLNETLVSAVSESDTAYLKALLKEGANAKYVSSNGWTALSAAAAYGSAEMVDILIAAGSDLNARDRQCGCPVLWTAARSNREPKQKVRSLLKAGANPHSGAGKRDLLMSAAANGDLEIVELLLHEGLSITNHSESGETALMAGAQSGNESVVSVLIKAGSQVNATDKEGTTALMRAAHSYNAAAVVEALLKAGADPNARDRSGRTTLQIAESSNYVGSESVVKILKSLTTTK
jgi:ankyrin repeat protein